MNMLNTGSQWLAQQLGQHASQCITYSRGGIVLKIDATMGSSTFESQDVDGAIHRVETRDFILTDVAKFEGRFGKPLEGDQINDGTNNYRVLAPGGEQPYRYAGQHRSMLRIHTKQL